MSQPNVFGGIINFSKIRPKGDPINENFVDREADVCDKASSKHRTGDTDMDTVKVYTDLDIVNGFKAANPDVDYLSVNKEIDHKGVVRYGCAMTFANCKDDMGKTIMVHLHTSEDVDGNHRLIDALEETFRRLVFKTGFDPRGADEHEYYESFDLSDDAEALASAGWGTDEDYGG